MIENNECCKDYVSKNTASEQTDEDIAKAFLIGIALGFGEKYDEKDKIIDEIKKVAEPQQKIGQWITEQERIKAICEVAHIDDISDLSDGYHTFRQLYYQRMMLFAALVKQNRDKAWKSLRHEDGELCFGGGWFIVGIDTPEGSYTYHYEEKYFSLFDCVELEKGKHWDGHTEKDVTRLLSLGQEVKE